ncbi:HAD family hydrolase [Kitasatospora sp. HPMI-4]|uniref:HAD family hydrolase n=1 Tax=Kitasatospora sp. HPMI-4 TaxID=3448443 RepID=UPI003F1C85EE
MSPTLVLWDVDRTLLYVGETDRAVYRMAFARVVGRPAVRLPERGTGRTMPLAVRELLRANDVPQEEVDVLAEELVALLPELLAERTEELRITGQMMPGAREALAAVHSAEDLVPTVVTGNLQGSAEIKLRAFGLADFVDLSIGGYASDDSHRPALVAVAQQRAASKHGGAFHRDTTVIIGDSLEDVRTGLEGGASVIAVASGTTPAQSLVDAGADRVLPDLQDPSAVLQAIAELTSS